VAWCDWTGWTAVTGPASKLRFAGLEPMSGLALDFKRRQRPTKKPLSPLIEAERLFCGPSASRRDQA
jgi:hypothetical protein